MNDSGPYSYALVKQKKNLFYVIFFVKGKNIDVDVDRKGRQASLPYRTSAPRGSHGQKERSLLLTVTFRSWIPPPSINIKATVNVSGIMPCWLYPPSRIELVVVSKGTGRATTLAKFRAAINVAGGWYTPTSPPSVFSVLNIYISNFFKPY